MFESGQGRYDLLVEAHGGLYRGSQAGGGTGVSDDRRKRSDGAGGFEPGEKGMEGTGLCSVFAGISAAMGFHV